MSSNRYFKGANIRKETDSFRKLAGTESTRRSDLGSGYNLIPPEKLQEYIDKVEHNIIGGDSGRAFDAIQREKNIFLSNGKKREFEAYRILDDLQDAILWDDQQAKADSLSAIRSTAETSSQLRESINSIIHEMSTRPSSMNRSVNTQGPKRKEISHDKQE